MLQHTKFERSIWPSILAPLLAGLLAAAVYNGRSQAAPAPEHSVYVIADHEGYGLIDCITQKRECGKIVADSWCEAHGHGPALSYGTSDDVTGSVASGRGMKPQPVNAVVACAD